jgi:S-adenosyl-L-methionine hydrolase (adenosine-forming)
VFITFLSDFGLQDDFVGTCRGVIARIAPEATVIDITHGIEPLAVLQGAIVLANTVPYMPDGVHLAVVDPGVGSGRRALAVRDASGRFYVGPDNGLLVPSAEKHGGVEGAWELTNTAYMLEPMSRTFHGRDVFAPAAAYLSIGVEPGELGPPVEPESLVHLELPAPEIEGSRIMATVLYVDRYGNVQLNLARSDMEQVGIVPGRRIELDLGMDRYYATAARTFADARPGDIILYEDSYQNIAVAITDGSAADMFAIRPGQRLGIDIVD